MKIIIPCAGRSSRFPNMSPKWMLPDHDGLPMVFKAVNGLDVRIDDLIFTVLREHDEKYRAIAGLSSAFGRKVHSVLLDHPTRSQSETVAETLKRTGLSEPFLIKDSDNYFELPGIEQQYNYVSVAALSDFSKVNPQNKSYVQIDQEDIIVNVREKKVISDHFSVGGYYFLEPQEFLSAYDELESGNCLGRSELYLSEIIAYMCMNGHVFKARHVDRYEDWGTVHEWSEKLQRRRVLLVSVDGFLFEQGSRHFSPSYEDAKPNEIPIQTIRKMASEGHDIRYLTNRPAELELMTRERIVDQGLPDGAILMDCDLAQWVILTAPNPNLPFRTSHAVEIATDDPNMSEKIGLQ